MAATIRVFLAFLVVLCVFSTVDADQNATTDDGRRVILRSDWTWTYLKVPNSCPGAPQGVPTFSAFTSFVSDSGSASFSGQPGRLMPLAVAGGQDLISGNQFVPGTYMVAAAVSNPDGRTISSWQEFGPFRCDAGHNYRAELHLDADSPRVGWQKDSADLQSYSQPAKQRFQVFARNDDPKHWMSICIFPEGGSVQDCCFFEGGNVSYVPAENDGQVPQIAGRWNSTWSQHNIVNDPCCAIEQDGTSILLKNLDVNWQASATIVDGQSIKAEDGVTGVISDDGSRIDWSNGSFWIRQSK